MLWRIGALVSLLTIALDPFTQQLVQLEQKLHSATDSRTAIAIANRYSKGNEHVLAGDLVSVLPGGESSTMGTVAIVFADADFSIQSAFMYGLTQPLSSVIQQLPFQCPTGNCTWSAFQSLAVCSVCNDVTSQLETIDGLGDQYGDLTGGGAATTTNATEFRLPNGAYINNFDGVRFNGGDFGTDNQALGIVLMTTLGTGNASQTNSFQDIDTLIWAMCILRMRPDPEVTGATWPNTPLEALECGLYYCVKSYKSSVVNGTLVEIETILTNDTRSPESWKQIDDNGENASSVLSSSQINSLEFNNITSLFGRTDLMLGQDFNISQVAVDSISSYLQTQLSYQKMANNTNDQVNGYYVNGTEGGGIQYIPSSLSALFASSDMNATFIALARSMSNALRAGSDGTSVLGGKTGTMMTYYKIVWPWITLHAVVVVLGTVFLLLTMWKSGSKRIQVWKTSSLATMAAGTKLMGLLDGMMTIEEMKERAKKEKVLLLGRGGEVSW
jgi:hypothetical protein